MLTGHQSYRLAIAGYEFLLLPQFDLTFPDFPGVDKVEVVSENERCVGVKVLFKEAASPEEAASIALVIATQIADRLAFQYKVSIKDPERGETRFTEKDGTGTQQVIMSCSASMSVAGHTVKTVPNTDVLQLKPVLAGAEPNRDMYYSQLRWIFQQEDPVARFMHLYKILLSLQGGANHTQGNVDASIASEEPSVQMVHNTRLGGVRQILNEILPNG